MLSGRRRVYLLPFLFLLLEVLVGKGGGLRTALLRQTLFLSLLPLASLPFLGLRSRDVGLSREGLRASLGWGLGMLFLALPLIAYGSTLPDFQAYYPLLPEAREDPGALLSLWGWVLLMMFNTEFFFRGYLLFLLRREMGEGKAIALQALPYALIHLGKPSLEVPYALLVGGIFGWVALRRRSILPSLLTHWGGAVLLDVFILLNV
jgi:membrane protease YdiL (CAAX protease family)